ncbi:PAS domain S-box-containing protein [Paucidesulfovibrio gracilis DSM 16080]|uniref:histidine kinase n=1 Tax=Paucidesulfovibrio gracilis DSM 16080 TaxID=1121449 RepID=A0A1T4Y717_9BACT|nr:response regulator [Paucidesulfovibrio gracilis]SKA97597.1 PAS domain S-box-containing protein [Paucidesulfovibrio gracilis DSM 16080]
MTISKKNAPPWNDLRRRAEALLQDGACSGEAAGESSREQREACELLHELSVYQVELDLQNEELREAQLRLHASRDRYQQIFDFAPIGYVVLNERGVILEANHAAAELLGVARKHLKDRPMITALPAEEHTNFFRHLARIFEGQAAQREVRLVPRHGREHIVRLTARSVWDAELESHRCLCAMEDVTELRRGESCLRDALGRAEDANKAKSAFLANMSHEIRTPLNGVLGILQLLSRAELAPREAGLVHTAEEAGMGLLELLNDVLEFSRIEAGNIRLEAQPFALENVLGVLERVFRPQVESKGIEFEVLRDAALPRTLVGEPGLLRQILFNLVGNAVKFTSRGRIELWAGPLPGKDGKGRKRILLTVSDTGIGIRDEELVFVCEEFRQVEQTYSRQYGGVGLGLSIVRRLVAHLDGTMAFDSDSERGTTVYVMLPFAESAARRPAAKPPVRAEAPDGASAEPQGPEKSDQQAAGSSAHLLVVEDDNMALQLLRQFLGGAGFTFSLAMDGQEALDALEREHFDCVLMDIRMPVMDGVEATRRIRESGKPYADVPILAMTAFASSEEREHILAAGMDGYLAKPLDLSAFLAMIKQLTRKA